MSEVSRYYNNVISRINLNPSRSFYRYGEDDYSYGDLRQSVGAGIKRLKENTKARIAICASKSYHTYAAIFSIILGGHTWIQLNPETPQKRVEGMLEIAKPDFLIYDQRPSDSFVTMCEHLDVALISFEDFFSTPSPEPLNSPDVADDDWSMIYFTSGSTGRPKGVPITHQSYIRNVFNILEITSIQDGDTFGDFHDLGFVISVPILFSCVYVAGSIVPGISKAEQFLPSGTLKKYNVSVLITVPSTLNRMMCMPKSLEGLHNLNVVISCGEPMQLPLIDFAFDVLKAQNLYNMYGSTEVAPWTFSHTCSKMDIKKYADIGVAPIGKPINGNDIRLLDGDELAVAGVQITPGYLDGESPDTFQVIDDKRWYKSGDRVIVRDGVYICKGRLDSQIKIDGYRIDAMDVEANLRSIDGIEQAFCFEIEGESGRNQLAAAVFGPTAMTHLEVTKYLKDRVPKYMIPMVCKYFDEVPYNKSGKIDRVKVKSMFS